MDTTGPTFSTNEIAESLGVSVPTIHRAALRLNLEPRRGTKRILQLSEKGAQALLEHLGKAPKLDGFTREELFILHVLQKRPFGLRSARAVARCAGISPSTASDALRELEQRGIVKHRCVTVAEGHAKQIEVWTLRIDPNWMTDDLAALIRSVAPPTPSQRNATQRNATQRTSSVRAPTFQAPVLECRSQQTKNQYSWPCDCDIHPRTVRPSRPGLDHQQPRQGGICSSCWPAARTFPQDPSLGFAHS